MAGYRQVDESCQVCSNVPNCLVPDALMFCNCSCYVEHRACTVAAVHSCVPFLHTQHTAGGSMLLQRLSQAGSRTALLQQAVCSRSMRAALPLTRRAAATAASATEAPPAAAESSPASSGVAAYSAPAYKVNLDFKFIRDNLQLVSDNCKIRDSAADPALVAQLYDDYVKLKSESDNLRSSRNENSSAMKVRCCAKPMRHTAGTSCATCPGSSNSGSGSVSCCRKCRGDSSISKYHTKRCFAAASATAAVSFQARALRQQC